MPEGWNAIQRDLNKAKIRGHRKVVMFHKAKESLRCEGGEALKQVPQRSCGYPIPRSVQDQFGWGSESPGLVGGVLVHGKRVGTG